MPSGSVRPPMSIITTIKQLLGMTDESGRDDRGDPTVTIEREAGEEPATETESAVKGGTAGSGDATTSDPADGTETDSPDDGVTTDATPESDAITESDTPSAGEDVTEPETGTEATTETEDGDTSDTADESETTDGSDASDEEHQAETATTSVVELKGIGPAYSDRLADAGIETVAELAAADAGELAPALNVGEGRVRRWIDRAREYDG